MSGPTSGGGSTPGPGLAVLVEAESRRRGAGTLLGRLVELPLLGGPLARAAGAPMRLRPVATRVTRFHAWLLRLSRGRLRRSWLFAAGQPVLSLTTTGRRSGLPRTTAVACFRCGEELALAAMNLGNTRNPDWALNLRQHPEATIAIGGMAIPVLAREARGEEAERLWRCWIGLQPSAEAFRGLAGREIPMFVLSRAAA